MLKLVVFDVDGTLADDSSKKSFLPAQYYTDGMLKGLAENSDVTELARNALSDPSTHVVVISGRENRLRQTTDTWLRKHLGTTKSVNPVKLHLRPDGMNHEMISSYKLQTVMSLIPTQPFLGLDVYEDDPDTLRMIHSACNFRFGTALRLFLVQDGTATRWSAS